MNIIQKLRQWSTPLGAVFIGLLGATLIYTAATESLHLVHVRAVGKAAVVEPIEQYTRHRVRKVTTFSALIGFTTERGEHVQRERTFPNELLADFEAGHPVTVLYDPAQPTQFVFARDDWPWFEIITGLGLLSLSGWRLWSIWREKQGNSG